MGIDWTDAHENSNLAYGIWDTGQNMMNPISLCWVVSVVVVVKLKSKMVVKFVIHGAVVQTVLNNKIFVPNR
jgi:hypothetical protein